MTTVNALNFACEPAGRRNTRNDQTCTCNHYTPAARILRSVEFNAELAQYYQDQPKSGDAIINDVLTEIFDYCTGRLFGPDGVEIVVDTKAGAEFFDTVFGADPRRFINRYRTKAENPPKNLLDRNCIMPVTVLHLARQIYLCRTQGRCSR